MRNARTVFVLAVIGVVLLAGFGLASSARPAAHSAFPLRSAATSVSLSANGMSPATLSLTWTQTTDACFSAYSTWYSETSSSGPWTSLGSITTATATSTYIYGLTPGAATWWEIGDTDCSAVTAYSNVVAVRNPDVAVLSVANVGATSLDLSWTNAATYGGMVGFSSYRVEAATGSSFAVIATITGASTRTYHATGLMAGTAYQFYVNTTDLCTGCSSSFPSATASNTVSATMAASVLVSVAADQPLTDVSMPVTFTCAATGGVAPFTYAWAFGDGGSASGSPVTHAYASAGTKVVSCIATDSVNERVTKTTSEAVHALPAVVASADVSSVQVGGAVTFTATVSGGTGTMTYTWNFGDGATGTGATVTHAYAGPGNYTANVTVTDAVGGRDTADAGSVQVQDTSLGAFFSSAGGILVIVLIVAVAGVAAYFLVVRRRGSRTQQPGTAPGAMPPAASVELPPSPGGASPASPPLATAPVSPGLAATVPPPAAPSAAAPYPTYGAQAPVAPPAAPSASPPPYWTPPGQPYPAPRVRTPPKGLELAGFVVFMLGVVYMLGATALGGGWVDDLIAAFIMFIAVILYGLAWLQKRRARPVVAAAPYQQPPMSPPMQP